MMCCQHLKSNMDRFIEQEHTSYAPCQLNLKSNMDRFIVEVESDFDVETLRFKIQYG